MVYPADEDGDGDGDDGYGVPHADEHADIYAGERVADVDAHPASDEYTAATAANIKAQAKADGATTNQSTTD